MASSTVPWERLRRATSIPASTMALMVASSATGRPDRGDDLRTSLHGVMIPTRARRTGDLRRSSPVRPKPRCPVRRGQHVRFRVLGGAKVRSHGGSDHHPTCTARTDRERRWSGRPSADRSRSPPGPSDGRLDGGRAVRRAVRQPDGPGSTDRGSARTPARPRSHGGRRSPGVRRPSFQLHSGRGAPAGQGEWKAFLNDEDATRPGRLDRRRDLVDRGTRRPSPRSADCRRLPRRRDQRLGHFHARSSALRCSSTPTTRRSTASCRRIERRAFDRSASTRPPTCEALRTSASASCGGPRPRPRPCRCARRRGARGRARRGCSS